MKPLVHVYIPTYNAIQGKSDFFKKTLHSLLNQTYSNYKIFISDDASTDSTVDVALSFDRSKIEILKNNEKGKGVFSNWNRCIEHAFASPECTYLTIFHQDDLYDPFILEKQVASLEEFKKAVVFTEAHYINEKDQILYSLNWPEKIKKNQSTPEELFLEIYTYGNSVFICPSAMFQKDIFQKVGKFSLEYPNASDLEMWFRILFFNKGPSTIGFLPEKLISYRLQSEQASSLYESKRSGVSDFFDVVEKYKNFVKINNEQEKSFFVLKNLDLLNIELKGILRAKNLNSIFPLRSLSFFKSSSLKNIKKSLGVPDFLKVLISLFLLNNRFFWKCPPFLIKKGIQFIFYCSDAKRNYLLQFLLKIKKYF